MPAIPAFINGGAVISGPSGNGSNGEVLTSNGSGATSWTSVSASPGGSSGQLQYNNSSAFGGVAGSTWQAGASPNLTLTAQNASYVASLLQGQTSHATDIERWRESSGATQYLAVSATAKGWNWYNANSWYGHLHWFDPGGQTDKPALGVAKTIGSTPPTTATISFFTGANRVCVGPNTVTLSADRALSASPEAGSIGGSGGSGTNVAGGSLTFFAGQSTGNATPATLIFQTSVVGSSGTTLQSLTDRMALDGQGMVSVYNATTTPSAGPTGGCGIFATSGELKAITDADKTTNLTTPQKGVVFGIPGTVTNVTVYLTTYATCSGTINSVQNIQTSAGTISAAFKINGTNITGLSAVSVTSSSQDANATAANTFVAGDEITMVLSSASSAADLRGTLVYTQTAQG